MSGPFFTVATEVTFVKLGELFSKMPPELREQFIDTVTAGICRHCWHDDPDGRCQCWNDE